VQRVVPAAGGGWDVTVQAAGGQPETRRYRAVIVANGHLSAPRMATFPGTFNGRQTHSHHYRTAAPFEDQRVLVIGIGNSAVDIAVDLTRQAAQVTLSTRRGAHVMPKYLFGVPTDRVGAFLNRHLRWPTRYTRTVLGKLAWLHMGDQERLGVPRPAHPIWREHACVSQDLLPYVGHGWIDIKPDVRRLDGDHVEFNDGSRRPFDAVIHATGYRTEFPFLPEDVFALRDHEAMLYRRMLPPDRPGLYFVGLVQPVGPTIPLVEVQARWVAQVLCGRLTLPDRDVMMAEVHTHLAGLRQQYVNSARYTLEVDYRTHAGQLTGDMQRGIATA
jgi:hypothetical protein